MSQNHPARAELEPRAEDRPEAANGETLVEQHRRHLREITAIVGPEIAEQARRKAIRWVARTRA